MNNKNNLTTPNQFLFSHIRFPILSSNFIKTENIITQNGSIPSLTISFAKPRVRIFVGTEHRSRQPRILVWIAKKIIDILVSPRNRSRRHLGLERFKVLRENNGEKERRSGEGRKVMTMEVT